ncbi:hypothetical protein IE53DRAFT_363796, partial [Violaceomyces palustris]
MAARSLTRSPFLARTMALPSPSSLMAFKISTATRSFLTTRQIGASVSSPNFSDLLAGDASGVSDTTNSKTPGTRAAEANLSPHERKILIEAKKQLKLKQYEARLKLKAMEVGVSSIEELREKYLAQKKKKEEGSGKEGSHSTPSSSSSLVGSLGENASEIERRDARLADMIRTRAEAEAKRKLESGELNSNPSGGDGPIK